MNSTLSETNLPSCEHTAIVDPVPSTSESGLYGGHYQSPHDVEREVQRALFAIKDLEFVSLEVHCMPDSICLTGVVRGPSESRLRLDRVASEAAGVKKVRNFLAFRSKAPGK